MVNYDVVKKILILEDLWKKKTYYNVKIIDIEKKTSTSGLTTKAALSAFENKI